MNKKNKPATFTLPEGKRQWFGTWLAFGYREDRLKRRSPVFRDFSARADFDASRYIPGNGPGHRLGRAS